MYIESIPLHNNPDGANFQDCRIMAERGLPPLIWNVSWL
jgi:hypothetical protein